MSFEIQRYDSNASETIPIGERDGEPTLTDDTDTTTGSEEEYIDPSTNDLTIVTGAALIVADCMGTGILALPYDINKTLGMGFGLFFLILNVFINLYAGTILCNVALLVERRLSDGHGSHGSIIDGSAFSDDHDCGANIASGDGVDGNGNGNGDGNNVVLAAGSTMKDKTDNVDWNYDRDDNHDTNDNHESDDNGVQKKHTLQLERYQTTANDNDNDNDDYDNLEQLKKPISISSKSDNNQSHNIVKQQNHDPHGSAHTFDFIGMTYALFDHPNHNEELQQQQHKIKSQSLSKATMIVTVIYYTNIFLVLGNYVLVMSHAVAAMIGESNICLPSAGMIASTLMFGLCQLRSMTSLGRLVSFVSLAALAVVVLQCLISIQSGKDSFKYEEEGEDQGSSFGGEDRFLYLQQERQIEEYKGELSEDGVYYMTMFQSISRQFAAFSSIGFAVGSQKLLLNIRHEFKDRTQAAPKSLGISLGAFGTVYALVCIMSGSNPPSFLFDAVSPGNGRRIAGFLLWVHVAVSFAINSQALCSSIDRIKFHRITLFSLYKYHRLRWAILTFIVSLSSFLIANAVPFFKDLVSLIGALTSVPLTLLLPAIYYRKSRGLPLCCWSFSSALRRREDIFSFLLVVFSVVFLLCGVVGSVSSIGIDWSHHGPPFACH